MIFVYLSSPFAKTKLDDCITILSRTSAKFEELQDLINTKEGNKNDVEAYHETLIIGKIEEVLYHIKDYFEDA